MKRVPVLLRLPKRDYELLKLAAKAYRAPSVNWFMTEMIACMLNPARWQEFSLRLSSGQHQQTMELVEQATAPKPKPKRGKRR